MNYTFLQFSYVNIVLFTFTGSLVDKRGKILIPGVYDSVAPLTDEEKKLYEKIDFDLCEYCKDVGVGKLLHDSKVSKQSDIYFTPCLFQNH